jgi:hypothetical protein
MLKAAFRAVVEAVMVVLVELELAALRLCLCWWWPGRVLQYRQGLGFCRSTGPTGGTPGEQRLRKSVTRLWTMVEGKYALAAMLED